MPAAKLTRRIPWEDRFQQPTVEILRSPYNKQIATLFDDIRAALADFEGASEQLAWEGVSWRWCFRYDLDFAPETPWTAVIPHPDGPRVSIATPVEVLTSLPKRRISKFINEELVRPRVVEERHWGVWTLANKSNFADLLDLAKRCHTHLRSQVAD